MTTEELILRGIQEELNFSATRSSGPGGQNVNKVNTKVELRFNVSRSSHLSDSEKELIYKRLGPRITCDGEILLTCQSGRSQLQNKREVTARFFELVALALTPAITRIKTKPGLAAKLKRLDAKRVRGELKKNRTRNRQGDDA
jgi:ribosome-associated protein